MNKNIINIEKVIRYGLFGKIKKGMSYSEIAELYDLPKVTETYAPLFISTDGIDIMFNEEEDCEKIYLLIEDMHETQNLFIMDDEFFEVLTSYDVNDMTSFLIEHEIAFQSHYEDELVVLTICSSGAMLVFYPDFYSLDSDDYSLFSIEV